MSKEQTFEFDNELPVSIDRNWQGTGLVLCTYEDKKFSDAPSCALWQGDVVVLDWWDGLASSYEGCPEDLTWDRTIGGMILDAVNAGIKIGKEAK